MENKITKWFKRNAVAVGACVLMASLVIVWWAFSSPNTTTIGEDISVGGNLTVNGTSSFAGISTFAGNVGIGETSPGSKLHVKNGDIKIEVIPSGTTGSYSLDWNALQICQFGTCCPPWKDCDGDNRTYEAQTDCNEGCNTCYVGSPSYTTSPDGKDQDCDGEVDESAKVTANYYLYDTATAYNGNLGGRSGADSKCNTDADKPSACVSAAWAFISVSASDEIRDMPTTKGVVEYGPWYFMDGAAASTTAANNWADLLDGSIANAPNSGGLDGTYYWTGSQGTGAIAEGYNCEGWTNSSAGSGATGEMTKTTAFWLYFTIQTCNTQPSKILCACEGNVGYGLQ